MSSEKSFSQSSLEFLVENAIYPMWSKKGEVYFRAKKGVLTPEKKRELVEELNLRTKEDCDRLREEVKKEIAKRRENVPIKDWIPEERPREMLMKYGADKLPLSKLLAIIPPRKGARICHYIGKGPPTQRDNHIEEIFKIGEKEWKDKNGYHRRSAIESFISQLKRRFGGVVRARSPAGQRSEIGIRIALLNQWRELERLQTIAPPS